MTRFKTFSNVLLCNIFNSGGAIWREKFRDTFRICDFKVTEKPMDLSDEDDMQVPHKLRLPGRKKFTDLLYNRSRDILHTYL